MDFDTLTAVGGALAAFSAIFGGIIKWVLAPIRSEIVAIKTKVTDQIIYVDKEFVKRQGVDKEHYERITSLENDIAYLKGELQSRKD